MDKNSGVLLILCLGMLSLFPNLAGAQCPPTYFSMNGHQAFILLPSTTTSNATSIPWVWYAPTIVGATPYGTNNWIFQNLLDKGIAVAGIDVGESYGSPAGRAIYSEFYTYATTQAHLAPKVCMLAQSRGGLMACNWAEDPGNASKLSAIAGIYPVCDLCSYPGLATAAPAYGMTAEELQAALLENDPIDRLQPLADAGVPIFSIAGDSDTIVPLSANSQVLYDRYTAMGGQMTLVVVPGAGHEEIPAFFQSTQLLDFMVANVDMVPEPSSGILLLFVGLFTAAAARVWRMRK